MNRLLAATLLAAACRPGAGAATMPGATAARPPLELHRPEHDDAPPMSLPVIGHMFPIGWSSTGLFAYGYVPPDEACGCFVLRVVIKDLITNRIVWEDLYQSGEIEHPTRGGQLTDVPAYWRVRSERVLRALRTRHMVARDEPALHAFATGAGLPRVAIRVTEIDDDVLGYTHLTAYEIDLTTAQGTRTIDRFVAKPGEHGPTGVDVPGYLPDPDGHHAAVLIEETWRGWEGPPSPYEQHFVGADLR